MRVVHAGDLALPSGRLITGSGGDIAFPDGRTAVDLGIAGGRYDVSLLMANLDGGNRRVAFAELALRPSPPVRWEDAPTLFFATDGGDGGYMSEEAAEYASTGNGSWRFASLDYASRQQPYPPCELIEFIDRRPLNAVIFATGWGDGRYPTVLGYDRGGNVSAVVTYTFVVPWRLAGLPGEPPMEVRNEEQRRARERGN